MTNILFLIAVLVIGALIYKVFVKKTVQTAETSNQSVSEPNVVDNIYQGLLNLNIQARDNSLDNDVLSALESVIDKVILVAEPINRPANYSELTVSVNRMHSKYIPSILNPYLSLNNQDRINQKQTFIDKLSNIESELDKVKEFLDSGNVAEFEKMSRFINAMFEKNDSDQLKGE